MAEMEKIRKDEATALDDEMLGQVAGGGNERIKVYRCTNDGCSLHRSWRSANITGIAPTCWKCNFPNEWKYSDEI